MALLELTTFRFYIYRSLFTMILLLSSSWWHVFLKWILLWAFNFNSTFFVKIFLRLLMKNLALLNTLLLINYWRLRTFIRVWFLVLLAFIVLVHYLKLIVKVNYYFAWLISLDIVITSYYFLWLIRVTLIRLCLILVGSMILVFSFRNYDWFLDFRRLFLLWWLRLNTKTIKKQLYTYIR
jgi:hypothetical protein